MISYKKESTNLSFLFVNIQKYGAKEKGNIAKSKAQRFSPSVKQ
jgi:hypothetical protein